MSWVLRIRALFFSQNPRYDLDPSVSSLDSTRRDVPPFESSPPHLERHLTYPRASSRIPYPEKRFQTEQEEEENFFSDASFSVLHPLFRLSFFQDPRTVPTSPRTLTSYHSCLQRKSSPPNLKKAEGNEQRRVIANPRLSLTLPPPSSLLLHPQHPPSSHKHVSPRPSSARSRAHPPLHRSWSDRSSRL